MKHITPQAQNHIFKDKNKKNKKPVPFEETTGFITLEELKVLEKKGKFSMDSDSENDYHISVDDANDKSTNDDLFTDEAEFQDIEEESNVHDEDEINDEINDETNDETNDEIKDEEEEEININLELKRTSKKQKKFNFTMKYEQVEDTW